MKIKTVAAFQLLLLMRPQTKRDAVEGWKGKRFARIEALARVSRIFIIKALWREKGRENEASAA